MTQELKTRLEQYKKVVQDMNDKNWKQSGMTYAQSPLIVIEEGTRYIKISKQDRSLEGRLGSKSVHTFIDKTNGDILKAATYKAPAKNGVRGNIFKEFEMMIDHHGAKYLR
jgi:hypothetical protein